MKVKRSKSAKRSPRSKRVSSGGPKRAKTRRASEPDNESISSSDREHHVRDKGLMGSAFGEPFSKMFNFQRGLLRAGAGAAFSAIDNPASRLVKDGVTESLQGGLKKLEHVFDERVAAALERLGMPSPELLQELILRVDQLTSNAGRDPNVSQKSRKRK